MLGHSPGAAYRLRSGRSHTFNMLLDCSSFHSERNDSRHALTDHLFPDHPARVTDAGQWALFTCSSSFAMLVALPGLRCLGLVPYQDDIRE
jgi:hypothetical protein